MCFSVVAIGLLEINLVVIFLLLVILLMLAGLHRRMSKMEGILHRTAFPVRKDVPSEKEQDTPEKETPFLRFLKDHPAADGLPKSEQWALYRKWRKEKGLNWAKN
ncbi:MAG: hypothetical protein V4733_05785 [Verrucomicrobiota bacterium]